MMNPEALLKKAQALGDDIREIESIDAAKAFEQAMGNIRKVERKRMWRMNLLRYAAMLSVPLLISSLVLGYLYWDSSQTEVQYAEVKASAGSVIRYELPDGSVAWLNAGSSLRYPTVFERKNRSVELKGEAYFEVKADREAPFYVNTSSGLDVFVYGTKFNVSAYEDDAYVETVLETGKVNVVTPARETIVLAPGEQLLYDKQSRTVTRRAVDVYGKVAWKDGKMIFRNASIEEIMKHLERHFNVEIELNNRYNKEYKYRATFRTETLQQILDYLAKSAALKWKIEEPEIQADDTLSKTKIKVDLY